ncbi:MAG: glucoamylase family protein [Phycisphaerales bacterium]
MKAVTALSAAFSSLLLLAGCASDPQTAVPSSTPSTPSTSATPSAPSSPAAHILIASPANTPRPPFTFSADDSAFLDLVQRGSWNWAMHAANKNSGMVPDRDSQAYVSTAGVGFQLASFPIAVEHGWITREEAAQRVDRILTVLSNVKTTRKFGMYQHFIDGDTGEMPKGSYEDVVSTIDSGLLFCGCIVASSYFGGEIAQKADALIAAADWAAFVNKGDSKNAKEFERGFLSLGWKPRNLRSDPVGEGSFLPYYWLDAGCEHRIVSFLAVAAPDPTHRADANLYYRLRRQIGRDKSLGAAGKNQIIYFPWSGAIFTNQFSHLFMNYAAMGPDNPAAHGVENRAQVDWWENARRTTNLHRARAIAYGKKFPKTGFGENAWGLTASDCTNGYQVSGAFPDLDEDAMTGARLMYDFSWYRPGDDFGDSSIAPYGAGMSILFEPKAAIAALRNYKQIAAQSDGVLKNVWADPTTGGHGFADAFNMEKDWVGKDHLAIDQLPMLIAIENARTGLVWRLFHQHPVVQAGMARLGLETNRR